MLTFFASTVHLEETGSMYLENKAFDQPSYLVAKAVILPHEQFHLVDTNAARKYIGYFLFGRNQAVRGDHNAGGRFPGVASVFGGAAAAG